MKTFRRWLMLLVAVLLPIRGALAAGLLCPVGGFGLQTEVQLTQHTHGHEASAVGHEHQQHEVTAQDHGAGHDHAGSGAPDLAGSAADKCNLCSAFCSVTGLISATVAIAAPQPVFTVFPDLYAPPASFVSDGQERPPRTI
ncbi:hypothetical protein A8M77_18445 [Variovorax sp. JS1663]|nr:hypothetical protein A8M77_18445 [Variovorax sp. JS1663]